uniref:CCHC-type domain-containing protein n=1 Tax=Panagrolaimus davidi TaxID=227884 RepID=A0A914P8S2_9BILA
MSGRRICYKCQEEGHMARECPNAESGGDGGGFSRGGGGGRGGYSQGGGGATYRRPLSCHNCKKQHLVEDCAKYGWLFCMFCWTQLYGQHHRCCRLWVKQNWNTCGNYRREMWRRFDRGDSYGQLRAFWYDEWSRQQITCVYCRRVPEHGHSYACQNCQTNVGCRQCCEMKYNAGSCCPFCDSPDW